jgi:hypothetical protein
MLEHIEYNNRVFHNIMNSGGARMAHSKAKKVRIRLEREGKLNPEHNRSGWNGINPAMRLTPTLAARKERMQQKYRWNHLLPGSDGSISFVPC